MTYRSGIVPAGSLSMGVEILEHEAVTRPGSYSAARRYWESHYGDWFSTLSLDAGYLDADEWEQAEQMRFETVDGTLVVYVNLGDE